MTSLRTITPPDSPQWYLAFLARSDKAMARAKNRRRQAILSIICGGTNIARIAEDMGLAPATIRGYLRKHGCWVRWYPGDRYRTYWMFGNTYAALQIPDWVPDRSSRHFDRALMVRILDEAWLIGSDDDAY
jgi:hypothetical protein